MSKLEQKKPILYSFRRCPFAMRARLIIKKCNINVLLREVELRDKPDCLIDISPKATVPVLVLPNQVIEQSMDIILWALSFNDPYNMKKAWLEDKAASQHFLNSLDNEFKNHLDRYKYSSRYEPQDKIMHRNLAMLWIEKLENKLSKSAHLSGSEIGIFDYISLPFVRQFRIADPEWFDSCNLPNLHKRLSEFLESKLFMQTMKKMPIWKKTGQDIVF